MIQETSRKLPGSAATDEAGPEFRYWIPGDAANADPKPAPTRAVDGPKGAENPENDRKGVRSRLSRSAGSGHASGSGSSSGSGHGGNGGGGAADRRPLPKHPNSPPVPGCSASTEDAVYLLATAESHPPVAGSALVIGR